MSKKMSNELFVQRFRLEFSDILGDTASITDIMVFVAIACLESDYGHSQLAIRDFNFFGMKSPKHRPTLNLDKSKTFASYSSRRACMLDFVCWLIMNKVLCYSFFHSSQLIEYIVKDCGYCSDEGYIDKLTSVYNKIKNW